ncbi:MAG: hypothetical protein A3A51_05120 [Candidatus Levybacteria bacterium RIFCSPLOWO2_01_FULL_39_10]|nr:MAG: hypothetical protein A3A51_05120 [Candidatus Levybacteria bacterium RIFCSPLOWO2_01_FULL_39_10]
MKIENLKLKIIFFGGRHTTEILESLSEKFEVLLVISSDQSVVNASINKKIPFAKVLEINEKLINGIKKIKPDIGVVADFGLIIPKKLIDVFPNGILNVHPSLLPKYRGPTPVQTAILNGDMKTGITIIRIDEKVDRGPIIFQEEHFISPSDNSETVYAHLFKRAAKILPDLLPRFMKGLLKSFEQNHKNATYTKSLKKEDGFIAVDKVPAKQKLERMINAYHPWPSVWTRYPLTSQKSQKALIKLHPGGYIHVEGKKAMKYKDFINGYERGEEFLKKLHLI